MRVIVTGGTGFIGEALCRRLIEAAHTPVVLTRNPDRVVQRLGPAADLQPPPDDYPKLPADNAPLSLRGSKLTIQSYLAGYPDESRARLRAAVREATESADYREGTQAFLEKREPKFDGR